MVHLVWVEDNTNEERQSVRDQLINCYRRLYFSPDDSLTEKEKVNYVVRNLIRFAYYFLCFFYCIQLMEILRFSLSNLLW